ncbi:MAG: hypothetical protein K0U54_02180 [Bacteroidetes bacterium]|nr:hypothetical protein [Bacteroidota bacterium]
MKRRSKTTSFNNPSEINDMQLGLFKIEKHHTGCVVEATVMYRKND